MSQELQPTSEDFQQLWMANPLAQEQLKNIVLQRMLLQQGVSHNSQETEPIPESVELPNTLRKQPWTWVSLIKAFLRWLKRLLRID